MLNGMPRHESAVRQAYVQQEDMFYAQLTVRCPDSARRLPASSWVHVRACQHPLMRHRCRQGNTQHGGCAAPAQVRIAGGARRGRGGPDQEAGPHQGVLQATETLTWVLDTVGASCSPGQRRVSCLSAAPWHA